ncbi:MAG: neutral/alkaline non-lysosomal ceramidase N-terminal domain-containing protein [Bacteroidota bacterium]
MLKAGFGKSVITPRVGTRLMGYANRTSPSTGVHDNLHARALALESNGQSWALCAVELCYIREPQVAAVREIVESRTGFPGDRVFISAVHTHSGPDDQDCEAWKRPLPERIAEAVVQAIERMRPARIGAGSGLLYGCSINRRWLDRPVDPFVGVVRVDDENGTTLGVLANFGCHAVVLGYDNLLISADWPGVTSQSLEKTLGPDSVCIVTQGGSGDVNPLTDQVRAHLQSGTSIGTMKGRVYYGDQNKGFEWHIGDRGGGMFEESATLGENVAGEVRRIMKTITPSSSVGEAWAQKLSVEGSRQRDDPPYPQDVETPPHVTECPIPSGPNGKRPLEIMLMGIEGTGIALIGEPGEIFAETAVTVRREMQMLGYAYPWVIGYANGWQLYLPPVSAYPEGGYEVSWAVHLGLSPRLQDRIWEEIYPTLKRHSQGE